jgi:uncharacterized protein
MLTRRGLLKGVLGLIGSSSALSAYAVGIEPLWRLSIANYAVTPQRWPIGLKLRIVALSDVHACSPWMTEARIASIVDRANALNGDVIVLLGDYMPGVRIPHEDVPPEAWSRALSKLKAPLGVHAILGNHDWWEDVEAMARLAGPTIAGEALKTAGINLLENDAIRLEHNGQAFWLAGLGDQIAFQWSRRRTGRPSRRGVDDLPATLAKLTDDAPAILLAHEPDIFPELPPRFALALSGHTHGGQVNLLGWRPVSASPRSGRYARGHFREHGRDLIVSSGLGCSILPIRLGVPPEIMVVEVGA